MNTINTHWVSLFVKPKYTTESSSLERTIYFDSFGVEHIPKEINKFIGNSDIKSNTSIRFNYVWVFLYRIY